MSEEKGMRSLVAQNRLLPLTAGCRVNVTAMMFASLAGIETEPVYILRAMTMLQQAGSE
jgi:hypothetical protein